MSGRLSVVDVDLGFAVVDRDSGEVVAYATMLRAFRFVRLVNALELDPAQIENLLGEGRGRRLLRTIDLRHEAPCRRCGSMLCIGDRARWNAVTGLAQHFRRCPAEIVARKTAA
jgi:hypothetical protein